MTIVYKAVTVENDRRYSINSLPGSNSGLRLEYPQGMKVVPMIPDSKLFAFRNSEDAWGFIVNGSDALEYEVWEAEAEGVTPGNWRATATIHAIVRFWERMKEGGDWKTWPQYSYIPSYEGTLYCDSITLLRRIE